MSKKNKKGKYNGPTLPKEIKRFLIAYTHMFNDTSSSSFFQNKIDFEITLIDDNVRNTFDEVFKRLKSMESLEGFVDDLDNACKSSTGFTSEYIKSFATDVPVDVNIKDLEDDFYKPNSVGGKHIYSIFDFISLMTAAHKLAVTVVEGRAEYYSSFLKELIDILLEEVGVIDYNTFNKFLPYIEDKLKDIYVKKFTSPLLGLLEQVVEDISNYMFDQFIGVLYDKFDVISFKLPEHILADEDMIKDFFFICESILYDNDELLTRTIDKVNNENNLTVDDNIVISEDSVKYNYIADWKDLNTIAVKKGFVLTRCSGDHGIFTNADGKMVVIPQGRSIGKGLSIKIQKRLDGVELVG